jgi:hypothetical protein
MRMQVQQIAAGHAGWPVQFRFAVHVIWSRVPELWTLGGTYKNGHVGVYCVKDFWDSTIL